MSTTTHAPPVVAEVRGRAGILTLNRPEALNALTQEMVDLMTAALDAWRQDPQVRVVILQGAGDRALCAGGDVVMLYEDALAKGTAGEHFWRTEYQLNLAIARYPKPYLALMTGIVLGGGIGVSAHGSHRVVTDSTRIGMPEVGIGFVPDVGGSYLLSRAPQGFGRHLALTAAHVGPEAALAAGFADYFVPEDLLPDLVERLAATGDVGVIETFAQPGKGNLNFAGLAAAYDAHSVEEVLDNLDALGTEDAQDAARRIRRACPLAAAVAWESLERARGLSLAEALNQEFRVSLNMHRNPNFREGVRAQLVDKDRNPTWLPARFDQVDPEEVAAMFGPIQDPRFSPLGL
ncbi:enoyl-CoA hydratase/isomerase family protein [Corynebacterium sp. 13CS0277]|uniref:enoyl-CoA hydratase/isomerase family protein n=1 Tax=Corynebacterium sp. 13CS0277 TaxID=2071994 RepID=UPI000D028AAA|nr:enoyl-CoA hydratase/isomerase family protein [Corynebacterium sp. 13CS0277]PRQ11287.1 enoyl-CoA hydratase/isomerase family protein [Corynebacterium sp. 13CS0277]